MQSYLQMVFINQKCETQLQLHNSIRELSGWNKASVGILINTGSLLQMWLGLLIALSNYRSPLIQIIQDL